MRKEIIKCDFCGKELQDKEEDAEFYEISRQNIPGWASYTGSMRDLENKKEMCEQCAKERKINF